MLFYEQPAIDLIIPDHDVQAGDVFGLDAMLMNPGPQVEVRVFILLEIYGAFYFWPSFSLETDFMTRILPENSNEMMTVLPEFEWPPAGSGEATCWGALLDSSGLLGYDTEHFTWH